MLLMGECQCLTTLSSSSVLLLFVVLYRNFWANKDEWMNELISGGTGRLLHSRAPATAKGLQQLNTATGGHGADEWVMIADVIIVSSSHTTSLCTSLNTILSTTIHPQSSSSPLLNVFSGSQHWAGPEAGPGLARSRRFWYLQLNLKILLMLLGNRLWGL